MMCDVNVKKGETNEYISGVRAFAPSRNKNAVLTLETALVLPLFLMASLLLMSFLNAVYAGEKIEAAICEEARYTAMRMHDGSNYERSGIKARVMERLSENILNSGIIKDGYDGLDFSDTDLSGHEIITVNVRYKIKPPFDLFNLTSIQCEKSVIMHSHTGYVNGLNGYGDYEYVYMTKNGSVYHKSRDCSHIKLTIIATDGEEVKNLRNSSGQKYKRCVYCKPKLTDSKLYVTSQGDKYHNSLSCQGLKRTVLRVRMDELGDIKPCSQCVK